MPTFTVTTALPYAHTERATMGLRAQLRVAVLDAGILRPVDWSQVQMTGPEEHHDSLGRTWFGYWATIRLDEDEPVG